MWARVREAATAATTRQPTSEERDRSRSRSSCCCCCPSHIITSSRPSRSRSRSSCCCCPSHHHHIKQTVEIIEIILLLLPLTHHHIKQTVEITESHCDGRLVIYVVFRHRHRRQPPQATTNWRRRACQRARGRCTCSRIEPWLYRCSTDISHARLDFCSTHWRVRGASYWRQSLSLADAGCMPLCAGLDSTQERHRVEGRILHLLFRGRQGPACRGMQATEQPFGPCTNDHL